jgi:hypothetical protein
MNCSHKRDSEATAHQKTGMFLRCRKTRFATMGGFRHHHAGYSQDTLERLISQGQ